MNGGTSARRRSLTTKLEAKRLALELEAVVVVIVVEVATVEVVIELLVAVKAAATVVVTTVVMMSAAMSTPAVSAAAIATTVTGESGRCKQAGQRKGRNRNQRNDETIHGTDSKARW